MIDPAWHVTVLSERTLRKVLRILSERDPEAVARAIIDAEDESHPAEAERL